MISPPAPTKIKIRDNAWTMRIINKIISKKNKNLPKRDAIFRVDQLLEVAQNPGQGMSFITN